MIIKTFGKRLLSLIKLRKSIKIREPNITTTLFDHKEIILSLYIYWHNNE